MARLHTSFILGYHGCSEEVGERVLSGASGLNGSAEQYDWLGPGIYFWDSDPERAWEWADWKVRRGSYARPFVVGAVIDLGNCLDLMARGSVESLAWAYTSLKRTTDAAGDGRSLPENKKASSADEDNVLRFLDCAVINHLHSALRDQGEEPFDSVRGLFVEGGPLFPGSGFSAKSHVQVAVVNARCIKGCFRVPRAGQAIDAASQPAAAVRTPLPAAAQPEMT